MREREDTVGKKLLRKADKQFGLLRLDDLSLEGLTRSGVTRWVEAGRLTRLYREVYAFGHTAFRDEGRWLAAVWACGDFAVLSHTSAAAYHRMTAEEPGEPVHVSTVESIKSRDGLEVHRVRHLDRLDVFRPHPLRVTSIPRTVVDIADVLPWHEFREAVDNLPQLHLAKITQAQRRAPGRRGAPLVTRLIEATDAHTKSEFERRFLRFVAERSLTRPDGLNVKVAGHKADCVYYDSRVVIELDGRAHHRRAGQMRVDRQRDRNYQSAGYAILRLVWDDLHPDAAANTAGEIRPMLARVR